MHRRMKIKGLHGVIEFIYAWSSKGILTSHLLDDSCQTGLIIKHLFTQIDD